MKKVYLTLSEVVVASNVVVVDLFGHNSDMEFTWGRETEGSFGDPHFLGFGTRGRVRTERRGGGGEFVLILNIVLGIKRTI